MSSPSLSRSTDDRFLGGVCGGLASAYGWDANLVRLVFLVSIAVGGVGLLAYLAAVLLVPESGRDAPLLRRAIDGEDRGAAAALVVATLVVLAIVAGSPFWFLGHWPIGWLVLAAAAGFLLLRRREPAPPADAPPAAVEEEPAGEEPTLVAHPGGPEPDPEPRPRGGGRIALGVTLLGVAVVGLVAGVTSGDVDWGVILASVVLALGAALVVVAPYGGARALIPLGLFVALATGAAAASDIRLGDGAGERRYAPVAAADVRPAYRLTAGRMTLDLRTTQLPAGTTSIRPRIGFGEIVVRLPETTKVRVRAHAIGGDLEVLGHEENGTGVDVDMRTPGAVTPAEPFIDLDADVGFGHLVVVRGDDPVSHPDPPGGAISLPGVLR